MRGGGGGGCSGNAGNPLGRAPGALQALCSGSRCGRVASGPAPLHENAEGEGTLPPLVPCAPGRSPNALLLTCRRLRVLCCWFAVGHVSMGVHSLPSLLSLEETVLEEEQDPLEADEAWMVVRSRQRKRGLGWPGVAGPAGGEAAPAASGCCTTGTQSMVLSAAACGFAVFSRWLSVPPSLPAPL